MSTNTAGSDRYFLGMLEISAMTGEPQEPPHLDGVRVIENLCVVPIGPDTNGERECRLKRFEIVECDVVLSSAASATVVPYRNRKVPSTTTPFLTPPTDSDTDTWQSTGGELVKRVPDENGGNVFQFHMNGARLMAFKVKDLSGGTCKVYCYGVMVGAEGF